MRMLNLILIYTLIFPSYSQVEVATDADMAEANQLQQRLTKESQLPPQEAKELFQTRIVCTHIFRCLS
jgi:DNA polymerase I-like protein with 3'-5' exonuclease and polymerase domains